MMYVNITPQAGMNDLAMATEMQAEEYRSDGDDVYSTVTLDKEDYYAADGRVRLPQQVQLNASVDCVRESFKIALKSLDRARELQNCLKEP